MDFEKQTEIIVQAFHYDWVDEKTKPVSDVRPGIRKLDVSGDDEHSEENGSYYDVAIQYDVIPAPAMFEASAKAAAAMCFSLASRRRWWPRPPWG